MTIFESLNNTTDKAGEAAEKYVRTSKEYLRLKVFQQLTIGISWMVKFVIIGGFIGLITIFLSVAGAIALGKLFNDTALGFTVVAFIFIILTIIAYALRSKIDRKIIEKVSAKFFE